jgi:hypothetical protein
LFPSLEKKGIPAAFSYSNFESFPREGRSHHAEKWYIHSREGEREREREREIPVVGTGKQQMLPLVGMRSMAAASFTSWFLLPGRLGNCWVKESAICSDDRQGVVSANESHFLSSYPLLVSSPFFFLARIMLPFEVRALLS